MAELKEIYLSLGFEDVNNYIQSGNVVFNCNNLDPSKLKNNIENKIKEVFDFDVTVLILTKNDLKNVIEENPFKEEDPKHLHLTFLSKVPSKDLIKDLKLNLNLIRKINMKKFLFH